MTPHISWAFAQRDLTAAQRLVLIALAERANGEKVCFPSFTVLAADCELSRRTTIAAVQFLSLVRGLISLVTDREERAAVFAKVGKRYNRDVNVYRINRPDDACTSSAKSAPLNGAEYTPGAKSALATGAKSARGGGATSAPHLVQNFPPASANAAPKSLKENTNQPPTRARAREEGRILNFEKKQEGGTSPPAPTPATPIKPTTPGSGPAPAEPDDFNAWVEGLQPNRSAMPLAVDQEVIRGEVVPDEDNPPVDPGLALAVLAEVRRSMRMTAYPPRAAVLSPAEMADACLEQPRVKPHYLPSAMLAAARADLAARAAARSGVS